MKPRTWEEIDLEVLLALQEGPRTGILVDSLEEYRFGMKHGLSVFNTRRSFKRLHEAGWVSFSRNRYRAKKKS